MKMNDLKTFKQMLKVANIEFDERTVAVQEGGRRFDETTLTVENGYYGFFTEICFNESGHLLSMRAYE